MSIKSESLQSPATVTVANQAEADDRIPGAVREAQIHLRIEGMDGPIRLDCEWLSWKCQNITGPTWRSNGILSVTVSGGEKPIHADWVGKLRDECAAAGVEFRFESWGEHCPISEMTLELMRVHDVIPYPTVSMLPNGRMDPDITREECQRLKTLPMLFFRVGSERSGRTLDGVVHDGETGRTA